MEQSKVDMYILANQTYFPANKIIYLKEKLLTADESKANLLFTVELKSPTTLLIVSLFAGSLGIDRFMMKDVGMGVLKLLTLGVCGVLTIVDWCTVMIRVREQNFNKIMQIL